MQCNVVKAFRQRLVRHGFTDIVIYDECNGNYRVWCVSPQGEHISESMSLIKMRATPRLVWFD